MADTKVFTSRRSGALWIAPDGVNTKPSYLPCYDLEDIVETKGSISLIQCIDARGEYFTLGTFQEPPEPTTTQLSTYIGKTADFLETVECPFPLFVHLRTCGRADSFENYDRTAIVQVERVTSVTRSGLVRKDEDVAAMHTFDVQAKPEVIDIFRLTPLAESVNETRDMLDIVFLDDPSCWDNCGETVRACDVGFAVSAGDGAASGSLLRKNPNLAGWQPSATDPFGLSEDTGSVTVFLTGKETNRILVTRATTDAGNPAEIGYSDDDGATWTNANVGSTNAEFFVAGRTLTSLNRYNIWAVSNLGYIYYSEDGGETWTTQEAGVITATAYNAVDFIDENNGYAAGVSGVVARTQDGGTTWGVRTAPTANDITSMEVLSEDRVWVGTDAGELFYTNDGGANWSSRSHGSSSTASITGIAFTTDYTGFLVQDDGSGDGQMYFTINGGFSWELQSDMPSSTITFNGLAACTTNDIYIVGSDGTIIAATI